MKMRKLSTLRVSRNHWFKKEDFEAFKKFLCEYKDSIDRVSLFCPDCHTPVTLKTAEETAALAKERMTEIRRLGFSAGINVLATIGHHPQYPDKCLHSHYRHMTNKNGEICVGSYCPSDEDYIDGYVKPLYRIVALAEPEFIWIDDDMRYGHYPIGYGCFCDGCVEKFNRDYGFSYSRKTLVSSLADENNIDLRRKWLHHQSEKIRGVLSAAADTVYSINNSIKMGLMTGERYFEGFEFESWAQALSQNGRYNIMWRPGGGNYNDLDSREAVEKQIQTGRQCAGLPEYVDEICYELESCPYSPLKKSPVSTANEGILSICSGCSGVAWNVMPKRLSDAENIFNAIRSKTPFMELLSEKFKNGKNLGVYDGWHPQAQAAVPDFFSDYGGRYAEGMDEIDLLGIPRSYNLHKASAFVLQGRQPLVFSDEEIRYILSRGVYMDADAADILCKIGFGKYIGFKKGDETVDDLSEVCLNHPLNKGIEGESRTCFSVFAKGKSYALIPEKGAAVISNIQDVDRNVKYPCAMGCFENELGGRVAVCGYFPWTDLSDYDKALQMKRLFLYLSNNALEANIHSYHRLKLFVRETDGGKFAAVVYNCNPDTIENAEIRIRDNGEYIIADEHMKKSALKQIGNDSGGGVYLLPELKPNAFYYIAIKE